MTHRRPYPPALAGMTAADGAAVLLVATAAMAAVAIRHITRMEVLGESMVPALCPGDRVLAVRGLPIRAGDVVAVADPRTHSRLLVKRVRAVGIDRRLELAGDNPAASTDSRAFGQVPPALVSGRVVWRYWPPERQGRVGL